MEIKIDNSELKELIKEVLKEEGLIHNGGRGNTISLKEFARKYCYPHGTDWVKQEILYKYKPTWINSIHPGKGRGFTVFESEAADWIIKNRHKLNWQLMPIGKERKINYDNY